MVKNIWCSIGSGFLLLRFFRGDHIDIILLHLLLFIITDIIKGDGHIVLDSGRFSCSNLNRLINLSFRLLCACVLSLRLFLGLYAFIKMVMLKKLFGKIVQLIIVIGFLRNRYKLEQLHLAMICLLKMELNNYFKHNLYILSLRVLIVQIIYKSNIFKIIIQL